MAGEIQLNSTTMATESSGSITAQLDTIRPNTTNGSLTLQGDSSNSGVTGLTIDSSGVANTTTAKVTNLQATSGQSLTIKDEDGNAAITVGTDNTASGYLSLNFGSHYSGSGTLSANTLSDFEEGSWTPVSTNGGQSNNTGTYRKIGSVVFLFGKMTFDSTTGSSLASVSGVPYLAAETTYVKVVMTDLSNIAIEIRPDRLNFNTETTTSFQNLTQMANKTVYFNVTYIAS